LTDPTRPIVDLSVPPIFGDIETSPSLALLHPELDVVIEFSNQGVYALFLDPTMIGGPGGAMGPDFNGDGVVDLADLAIWQANVGIMSGASVLQGDADGDGDVDGDDFLFWQRNAGMPPPWTGSGSGSGSGTGAGSGVEVNVPEPAGLALMLSGSLMLALRRRRNTHR
jgi:hypothetical protein